MTVLLPRAGAPIADSGGQPTREHYQWCARITEAVNTAATPVVVEEEAAPADPSLPLNTLALGLKSVEHFGRLADGQVSFALRGDVTSPGISYVYGTNATGVRGWRELATTTNLDEGSNLYYTDARADARVAAGIAAHEAALDPHPQYLTAAEGAAADAALITASITDGDTTHAPSGDAVFDALALKLDDSQASAFGLTLLDDADAATARATLDAMPASLVVSGTNVDYTYVAADANVARGKTTGTPRNFTADASVLTVGAFYYAANYASTGDVTLLPFAGTTLRSAGVSVASFAVTPFKLTRFWVRSSAEVWII